ncbi:uncharacterized protein MONOS_13678 [Monocercomonoides exilis]|uniref:uncharacterized protein n=1 Tax=Monocercomonoides exilis TaxID=2049356 RepID=UPI00355AC678|nr:hypothetical protein MONOS_13678 [Monocercomonoides exilis]|eukprot:MONOS_13678.1-p1 / transcript=MONOS_13678.1 / gene=MONOS_13678 / organism=Monocercomonoides_exilis_PA203 / gene_product=unspecified product / transcript_product=unspecified product / location=Mono_scaffold00862:21461-21958(+) / protein_length=166 / sequence_SO=supercontig / SO=protein_coding / is_pseudo=false
MLNEQYFTESVPEDKLNMQIAPPFDILSSIELFVPIVFDPFHSHQMNEFVPLVVIFCLLGCCLTSFDPMNSTFLFRQHPMNEVFEVVKDAKGLLREGTIPPSYASQTDEKEQLLIKHEVWENEFVGDGQSEDAVEMLKNVRYERDTKGIEGEERNGAEETQKEEK